MNKIFNKYLKYKSKYILEKNNLIGGFNITPNEEKILKEDDVCTICFGTFVNKKCNILNCYHLFHTECINNWFNTNTIHSCPICRRLQYDKGIEIYITNSKLKFPELKDINRIPGIGYEVCRNDRTQTATIDSIHFDNIISKLKRILTEENYNDNIKEEDLRRFNLYQIYEMLDIINNNNTRYDMSNYMLILTIEQLLGLRRKVIHIKLYIVNYCRHFINFKSNLYDKNYFERKIKELTDKLYIELAIPRSATSSITPTRPSPTTSSITPTRPSPTISSITPTRPSPTTSSITPTRPSPTTSSGNNQQQSINPLYSKLIRIFTQENYYLNFYYHDLINMDINDIYIILEEIIKSNTTYSIRNDEIILTRDELSRINQIQMNYIYLYIRLYCNYIFSFKNRFEPLSNDNMEKYSEEIRIIVRKFYESTELRPIISKYYSPRHTIDLRSELEHIFTEENYDINFSYLELMNMNLSNIYRILKKIENNNQSNNIRNKMIILTIEEFYSLNSIQLDNIYMYIILCCDFIISFKKNYEAYMLQYTEQIKIIVDEFDESNVSTTSNSPSSSTTAITSNSSISRIENPEIQSIHIDNPEIQSTRVGNLELELHRIFNEENYDIYFSYAQLSSMNNSEIYTILKKIENYFNLNNIDNNMIILTRNQLSRIFQNNNDILKDYIFMYITLCFNYILHNKKQNDSYRDAYKPIIKTTVEEFNKTYVSSTIINSRLQTPNIQSIYVDKLILKTEAYFTEQNYDINIILEELNSMNVNQIFIILDDINNFMESYIGNNSIKLTLNELSRINQNQKNTLFSYIITCCLYIINLNTQNVTNSRDNILLYTEQIIVLKNFFNSLDERARQDTISRTSETDYSSSTYASRTRARR